MAAWEEERSNEELVAAAFSAMLNRRVITEQEYKKRRHEPEFSKVEELNYDLLSQTVYASATGSFGDIFGSSGEKINIRLVSLMGKVTYLNVGKDSYVEELQALLHEEEHISGLRGHYVFIYGGRLIEKGHRLSEYQYSLVSIQYGCILGHGSGHETSNDSDGP
ncbi:hypothetical protein EMCRGX_G018467 [Ephydatia muelleri]